MNFSPFGTHFPGIHQFVSGTTTTTQDNSARYNTVNTTNTNSHFNQNQILSKFRTDESVNNANVKYTNSNVATTQYGTVSYSQPAESKDPKMVATTASGGYQTLNQTKDSISSIHHSDLTQDLTALLQQTETKRVLQNVNSSWQTLTTPASTVADYLSHLPASTLPLSLHHFLKYSAENIKKEAQNPLSSIDMGQSQNTTQTINLNNLTSSLLPSTTSIANIISQQQQNQSSIQGQSQMGAQNLQGISQTGMQTQTQNQMSQLTSNGSSVVSSGVKKKKKKKSSKDRKPRPKPGEIRVTQALDGSPLYACPDCQVCYPERGILEQHMIGHNLERKFVCDVCNAALKRKDHLTRHKQSHNPERPFICTVCLKAFKRKEQLTLHIVIHSGLKRHVCVECNKGFYRKDHLRKHTRSHIARRVKAELSTSQSPGGQQQQTGGSGAQQGGQQTSQAQLQAHQIQNQLQQQIQQAQQLHAQLTAQQQQLGNSGMQSHQGQMMGH